MRGLDYFRAILWGIYSVISDYFYQWLRWGTSGYEGLIQRRLILTNALVAMTVAASMILAITMALGDFYNLRIPVIFLCLLSLIMFFVPLLHGVHQYLGSLVNLGLWLLSATTTTYLLGSDTNVHLGFLAGMTSASLIFGTRHNAISIFSICAQMFLFWYADRFWTAPSHYVVITPAMNEIINIVMIFMILMTVFLLVSYAFSQMHRAENLLAQEYEYSERLLANMMPSSIASQLKREPEKTIANAHDEATILFADVVGFTERSHDRSPDETVDFLNRLFTRFDNLATKHGIEKIKTLGDAFMVAGGMPNEQPDHSLRVARMALDMLKEVDDLSMEFGEKFLIRVGMHSGPVVAGVIGTKKPFYDVWGDTVNLAARLETTGEAGKIHVSEATKDLLQDQFVFESRGVIDLKGKGRTQVWFMIGEKV